MFETWKNAFKQEDLRKKILYTLFIIFIFHIYVINYYYSTYIS